MIATEDITTIDLSEARRILLEANDIVLTTHMSPDGDALGSEGGLYYFLKQQGKNVRIINTDGVPGNLSVLGDDGIFEQYSSDAHDQVIGSADVIAVLDVNTITRIDRMEDAVANSTARKLVIDHHTNPRPFADAYCIDTETSATGELIYDLIANESEQHIGKDIALHLYVAIMTDTGSFRFERTTPKVHRIIAQLLETGLDVPRIHERVFDSFAMNRTRLLGMVLEGIQPICDGKATILTVTGDMMEKTETSNEDTEGFVNYGLGIGGVQATAMMTELDGVIKISFRSRGDIRVNDVARSLGGGGHVNAAAARITDKRLDDVRQEVEQALCGLFGS